MSMCSDTPCVSRVLFKNSGVQVTALKKKKKALKEHTCSPQTKPQPQVSVKVANEVHLDETPRRKIEQALGWTLHPQRPLDTAASVLVRVFMKCFTISGVQKEQVVGCAALVFM